MRRCYDCGTEYREIARNDYCVFYQCKCNRNKGADWDWKTGIIDGVEYELGSAGSWILRCTVCGDLAFRQRPDGQPWCIRCCWNGKESRTELIPWHEDVLTNRPPEEE